MSEGTVAGHLAVLYGDQTDPEFVTQDPWVPTLEQLEESHFAALCEGADEAAVAIATEIRRVRGEGFREAAVGELFGSKAGLWRLQ